MTDPGSPSVEEHVPPSRRGDGALRFTFRLWHLLVIVASLLIASSWMMPTINDNVKSRLATVDSLVERATVQIDDSQYVETIDKVRIDGHFYSEKPPLLSFVVAAVYLPVRAAGHVLYQGTAAYSFLVFVVLGGSFLLCLVCFHHAACRFGLPESTASWMAAMLALGTLCLPFNATLNNHGFAASWLFIGMYGLLRALDDPRPLWMLRAGLAFAIAFGADYSTALVIAPFGVYILLEPALRRRLLYVALPSAAVLAAGLGYNHLISGSIRFVQTNPEFFRYPGSVFVSGGEPLTGIERNSVSFAFRYALQMLFGRNGFLLYSPLLLFAIVAAVVTIVRRRPLWKISAAVLAGCAAFIAYYAFYSTNFSGCSYSIRWFVAFTPILWFLALPLFLSRTRWLRIALSAVFGASVPIALLGVVNPWTCAVPAVLANFYSWNEYVPVLTNTLIWIASIAFAVSMICAALPGKKSPVCESPAPVAASPRMWLGGILLLAFALRIGVAIAWPASDYADEIFQTREQAHRLVYNYGVIPWEFREGIRNWIFPAVLSVVIRATAWIAPGSYGYTLGINTLLCALSLSFVWVGFRWGERIGGLPAAIITAFTCATWQGLIYYAPQALTEAVASYALLPGLYLGYFAVQASHGHAGGSHGANAAAVDAPLDAHSPRSTDGPPVFNSAVPQFGSSAVSRHLLFSGVLLGLAVGLRVQLAPAVFVAVVWICRADWRRWLSTCAGIAASLLCFGLVDLFTWGYPFASYWNSITVNFLHHKSNIYGKEPASWYFDQLETRVGPILIALILGCRRSWFLTSVAAAILVTHLGFAHKEYRFIFPMVPILCVLIGLALASSEWKRAVGLSRHHVLVAMAVVAVASGAWAARLGVWHNMAGPVHAFRELSVRNDVCGLGIPHWIFGTGGYFYLHHNVPIYFVAEEFPHDFGTFNYITSRSELEHLLPREYVKQACWDKYCIYQRPGSCTTVPGYDLNDILSRMGR